MTPFHCDISCQRLLLLGLNACHSIEQRVMDASNVQSTYTREQWFTRNLLSLVRCVVVDFECFIDSLLCIENSGN